MLRYYLIASVLEFESRRGEAVNLFAKQKKWDKRLRAPSVAIGAIRRESTREGKGCDVTLLALKGNARAVRSGEGGGGEKKLF